MEEFIQKLALETPLSYNNSKYIVELIQCHEKSIEKAKEIYENNGYNEFLYYVRLLEYVSK